MFDAWLNPKTLSQFILPMPGMPQPQVETDPREGGDFTIIMQVGDEKIPHTGQYLEISRPIPGARLVPQKAALLHLN